MAASMSGMAEEEDDENEFEVFHSNAVDIIDDEVIRPPEEEEMEYVRQAGMMGAGMPLNIFDHYRFEDTGVTTTHRPRAGEQSPLLDGDRMRAFHTAIDIHDDFSTTEVNHERERSTHCMNPIQCLFYMISALPWASGIILTCLSRILLFLGRRAASASAYMMLLRIFCLSKAGVHAFSVNIEASNGIDIWAFGEGAAGDEICLDTGCSRPLFRLDTLAMLTNVKKESARAVGIAGQTASITHTGYCPGREQLIGKIFCSGDVRLNLMSVPQLMANGCTVMGKGHRLDVFEPSGKILFKGELNKRGLFVCPLSSLQTPALDRRNVSGPGGGMNVINGLEGVLDRSNREETPEIINREKKTKTSYDHDDDYDLSKMKPGISDEEFYRFMHGHFTQEERKRAITAWNLHEIWGHPGQKAMGDMLENGLIAGCTLTRKDLDNAFKMFGPCFACLEGKFKLPSEPPSESEPAPTIGHTLNADLFIYKLTTLGGYNFVVIATDQKSGAMFQVPIKQKTASCVEGALQKIIGSLNRHGHRVSKIVFDSEAVFLAMQDRVSVMGVECGYTPAGLHNKPVERAMQTLKSKMRTMRACLDYELPKHLYGELMAAAVSAINATPNTRSGTLSTPFQLVTGRRPTMKHFKFGQVGLCESRRQGDDDVSEWAMYLGTSGNMEGHHRVYIPTRGLVYSRRSFKSPTRGTTASASAPKEWGFAPRIVNRIRRGDKERMSEEDTMSADEILNKMVRDINVEVQKGKPTTQWDSKEEDTSMGLGQGKEMVPLPIEKPSAPSEVTGDTHAMTPAFEENHTVAPTAETQNAASTQPVVRRSSRSNKFQGYVGGQEGKRKSAYHASLIGHVDARSVLGEYALYCYRYSVRQGLNDPDLKRRDCVLAAIKEELRNIMMMKAFQPVKRRDISLVQWEERVYPSHMFLKDKYKLGVFERIKARLVAGGDYVSRLDAGETKSPTVNPMTVMMMINIAAVDDLEVSCHDIKGAFLLTDVDPNEPEMFIRLDKEVAEIFCGMRPQHKDYRDNKGYMYMKLRKYLYGLPQASHRFNRFIDTKLKFMGFTALPGDPCAYTRVTKEGRVNLALHVDDMLVTGKKEARLKFLTQLGKQAVEFTTQEGPKLEYLGMTIAKTTEGYRVSQESYKKELCSRFETDIAQHMSAAMSPAGPWLFEHNPKAEKFDRVHYLGMVMSALYLTRLTHADIPFPTLFLATRSQSPTVDDYQKLCRVLKYVKRGPEYGVLFRKDAGICATVYTDASHGLHEDGKGQIGIIATLGSGYVGARSSKIKMITLSSTESEQLALCEATTYAKWMRKMLKDLGHEMKTPTKLYMDNDSAIWLSERMGSWARNKHIMIRRNFTLEGIMMKDVRPTHIRTEQQPADMLTKDKAYRLMSENMKKIGMVKIDIA